MNKRQVMLAVLAGEQPPYVPWSLSFTLEAARTLQQHYAQEDLETVLHNHILGLGNGIGFFEEAGPERVKDVFGVVWDRSVDKDIGVVCELALPAPTLAGYTFPDPLSPRFFEDFPTRVEQFPDRLRVFQIGFSLYERAWTMRGMENLMMDFLDHPAFVHQLLNRIGDYNIAQVERALQLGDIDAVHFGDDWGSQRGLQMGPRLWREFIYPVLKRMYASVRAAGKYVSIHSCGDVDELFPELIDIGLNCFNPFQPEVMDVYALLARYRGRLAFHGGLSTQRMLPYGSVADVQAETRRLLTAGRQGGYIFAPAHAVESDVPLENMLAFIDVLFEQPGFEQA
jgi:uroporphyrinogen decarboxylase